jgi:hypothetical protein
MTKMTASSSDDWIYWHHGYKRSYLHLDYRANADLHTTSSTVTHIHTHTHTLIQLKHRN